MGQRTLHIPYPEELPQELGETPEAFENELRFLVAAKLYELGRVSSAQAATLAGVSRVAFLETLGRYRVSALNYPIEELERELKEAQERAHR